MAPTKIACVLFLLLLNTLPYRWSTKMSYCLVQNYTILFLNIYFKLDSMEIRHKLVFS